MMSRLRFLTTSKVLRRILVGLLIAVCLAVAISWNVASQLIAPKPLYIGKPPTDFPAVAITLDSDSGETVAGWHCHAENSKGVVLLLHGIRESRLRMLDRARFLYHVGYSIVMIDFQSHGESTGETITMGVLEKHDVQAAIDFAANAHPHEKIAVLGVSLGGAATLLSNPKDIDSIILESVFPTIRNAVHNRVNARLGIASYLPAEILLFQLHSRLGIDAEEIRPIDALPKVNCPVFIMSGDADPHTTADETRTMYEAVTARKKMWLVKGAAHVDLHQFAKDEYEQRLIQFLEEALQKVE